MKTPEDQPADNIDKIMLLAMWAKERCKYIASCNDPIIKNKKMIFAGMGKPTYPISRYIIDSHINYWSRIGELADEDAAAISDSIEGNAAIDYGDPRGDEYARSLMATAMSKWYKSLVLPDNILFTVGGAGALRVIFDTFNALFQDQSNYRVITPFPYYTFYANNRHQLHPIDVIQEQGYRLTARSLQLSIDSAYILAEKDKIYPKILLLCNPHSPLGTVIDKEELMQIVEVLKQYPEIYILLDEVYAEICFNKDQVPDLLTIAPELKNRIIIIRSATKALSAAGERMSVILAFDKLVMTKLLEHNINTIGHAPRSSQIAYAETMMKFTNEEQQKLVDFYHQKVEYVAGRLRAMDAYMPDPEYKVAGTFYIVGDFSDLLGVELTLDTVQVLEKSGHVSTSEELAYYLLFNEAVMIAPLAYFGMAKNNGFMRITCSGSLSELCELMDRLELRLSEARRNKKHLSLSNITPQLIGFNKINTKTTA